MLNSYKIKNLQANRGTSHLKPVDVSAEVGDIKDIQKEIGKGRRPLDRILGIAVYVVIFIILVWIFFQAEILKGFF